MGATGQNHLQMQDQFRKRGIDSSGLNPIYEHTRLQGEYRKFEFAFDYF